MLALAAQTMSWQAVQKASLFPNKMLGFPRKNLELT
jgi:hypothetical protein